MALTDIKVRTTKPTDKQYKLTDGSGMHLRVHPNGSTYWCLQCRFGGKQKVLALGVSPDVSGRCKSVALTFREMAIEWHAPNKKWSEEHSRRVLWRPAIDSIVPH